MVNNAFIHAAMDINSEIDLVQPRIFAHQLQDSENGKIILLDVTAGKTDATEPVRIIYPNEKSTDSTKEPQSQNKSQLSAPVPVALTRYAAQQLYAPLRTVERVIGI
ncbi:conjugal transfer protein [Xenorhabdus indica]|nr:conjugal transfer protein [Xenorhabdus indica]